MKYTMKQAARLALDVQDACNLSGVVKTFATVLDTLWTDAHERGKGTDWVNTHPVTVLFVNKLESLTHSDDRFRHAYEWCKEQAE